MLACCFVQTPSVFSLSLKAVLAFQLSNLKAPAEKQVLISPPAGIYEFYITIKSVKLHRVKHPVKKYTNLKKINKNEKPKITNVSMNMHTLKLLVFEASFYLNTSLTHLRYGVSIIYFQMEHLHLVKFVHSSLQKHRN